MVPENRLRIKPKSDAGRRRFLSGPFAPDALLAEKRTRLFFRRRSGKELRTLFCFVEVPGLEPGLVGGKLVELPVAKFFERANFAPGGRERLLTSGDFGGRRLPVHGDLCQLGAQRALVTGRAVQLFGNNAARLRRGAHPLALSVEFGIDGSLALGELALVSVRGRKLGPAILALAVPQGQQRLQAKLEVRHA
jgi:hypothetical protein